MNGNVRWGDKRGKKKIEGKVHCMYEDGIMNPLKTIKYRGRGNRQKEEIEWAGLIKVQYMHAWKYVKSLCVCIIYTKEIILMLVQYKKLKNKSVSSHIYLIYYYDNCVIG
jgi:hypothetical protein